ncbi:MAG: hypothetical protein B7Y82_05290 [Sphingomonadales bacterium 32-65-25]|nr:MAG: hypothetical protein B7Z50_00465 [Sphingomonadales bacterium 12-62-5]OYX78199.1 MAG: hypothetical protein B7Y82_05290 [Sphingomonadales bacterium 32-65-25]
MSIFLKDPGGVIEHAVDWDAGYLAGRTISQSIWEVEPPSLTPNALTLSGARLVGGRAAVTLSGGVAGNVYRVTGRVTLSDGSSDERTLVVRVEER